jgi:hypothetical protein
MTAAEIDTPLALLKIIGGIDERHKRQKVKVVVLLNQLSIRP